MTERRLPAGLTTLYRQRGDCLLNHANKDNLSTLSTPKPRFHPFTRAENHRQEPTRNSPQEPTKPWQSLHGETCSPHVIANKHLPTPMQIAAPLHRVSVVQKSSIRPLGQELGGETQRVPGATGCSAEVSDLSATLLREQRLLDF